MKQINDDNIDEIMFQLLEGEITGEEREQLLGAITADKEYNALWQAWQHTILLPENDAETMDIKKLKKNTGRIIPFNYKYAIAAMLVLGLGIALLLTRQNPAAPGMADRPQPGNKKVQEIRAPKPEIKTIIQAKEDTVITLKEKARMMAGKQPSTETKIPVINIPTPEKELKSPVIIKNNPETIAQAPKQNPIEQKLPDIISDTDPNDHILVSITSSSKPISSKIKEPTSSKTSLLSKLLGRPKFKLENDSTTRTNKKLIIENNQYKIIAGF